MVGPPTVKEIVVASVIVIVIAVNIAEVDQTLAIPFTTGRGGQKKSIAAQPAKTSACALFRRGKVGQSRRANMCAMSPAEEGTPSLITARGVAGAEAVIIAVAPDLFEASGRRL